MRPRASHGQRKRPRQRRLFFEAASLLDAPFSRGSPESASHMAVSPFEGPSTNSREIYPILLVLVLLITRG